MYNAGIALKAAKDLNADSLVPELYRKAADDYFKAKQAYRLKNFLEAKKLAQLATKLSEEAEFEAYRMGGATPEIRDTITAPEGASPDTEASFQDVEDSYEYEKPKRPERNEPSLPAQEEPSFAPLVTPGESAAPAPAATPAAPPAAKPQGQTGPTVPSTNMHELRGNSSDTFQSVPKQDLTPKKGSPRPARFYEGAKEISPKVEPIGNSPIQPIERSGAMPALGGKAIPSKNGLDSIEREPLPGITSAPVRKLDEPLPDALKEEQKNKKGKSS